MQEIDIMRANNRVRQTCFRSPSPLLGDWYQLANCMLEEPHSQCRIGPPLVECVARKDILLKRNAADGIACADTVLVGTRGPLEYFCKPIYLCGVLRGIEQHSRLSVLAEGARSGCRACQRARTVSIVKAKDFG